MTTLPPLLTDEEIAIIVGNAIHDQVLPALLTGVDIALNAAVVATDDVELPKLQPTPSESARKLLQGQFVPHHHRFKCAVRTADSWIAKTCGVPLVPATTDWYHPDDAPVRDGEYEIQQRFGEIYRLHWRCKSQAWFYPGGGEMCCEHGSLCIIAFGWRGLTKEAHHALSCN